MEDKKSKEKSPENYRDYRRTHAPETEKEGRADKPAVKVEFFINIDTNYSLIAYPLQVLATNRMVDSMISRKQP